MTTTLYDLLFGCRHKRLSFPQSRKRDDVRAATTTGTYVVCLDCGREFPYDWQQMRVVDRVPRTTVDAELVATQTFLSRE